MAATTWSVASGLPPRSPSVPSGQAWGSLGGASPFEQASLDPPSHASSGELAGTPEALHEGPKGSMSRQGSGAAPPLRQASLGRRRSLSHAGSGPPELWRDSVAVTERAASLGFASLSSLCGSSYVPPDRLRKSKPLGEGAFAGEAGRRPASVSSPVRPLRIAHHGGTSEPPLLTFRATPPSPHSIAVVDMAQLQPAEGGDERSSAGGSSVPRTVAVKRLKAQVLENEEDVVAFIQEARLLIQLKHPAIIEFIGLGAADESSREAEWRTMFLVQEVRALPAHGGTTAGWDCCGLWEACSRRGWSEAAAGCSLHPRHSCPRPRPHPCACSLQAAARSKS